MFREFVYDAAEGSLWVDRSVAVDARRATEEWLSKLDEMYQQSTRIPVSGGFSDLPSALQLAEKFDKTASNPQSGTGLQQRLAQFIAVGQELSELLATSASRLDDVDRAAAKNYLQEHRNSK